MIRLGFLGTGWIGRKRLEAILAGGEATVAAVHDPDPAAAREAHKIAPMALEADSLEAMLALQPDGLVIATPSAMHADQCVRALDSGVAIFCQKPLGRSASEVAAVIAAAKAADRLLGVDLSYRHIAGMAEIRSCIRRGGLGQVFAADLTFHNAYGPGAGWFWNPRLSGGGCLIDLGVHLVDLALWMFDFPEVTGVKSTLLRNGRPKAEGEVEDYAIGQFQLEGDITVRISCSWNLNAGRDALIEATFYGTQGGARMRNENGSFFDFSADLLCGRIAERIASPPDDWGGRAAVEWVKKLAQGEKFAGSTTGLMQTAETLDRLYASSLHHQPFTRSHVSMMTAAPSVR